MVEADATFAATAKIPDPPVVVLGISQTFAPFGRLDTTAVVSTVVPDAVNCGTAKVTLPCMIVWMAWPVDPNVAEPVDTSDPLVSILVVYRPFRLFLYGICVLL